jgi:hypothetical protein
VALAAADDARAAESSGMPKVYDVTVPPGVEAGQDITFRSTPGYLMQATVPPNMKEGDVFHVELSDETINGAAADDKSEQVPPYPLPVKDPPPRSLLRAFVEALLMLVCTTALGMALEEAAQQEVWPLHKIVLGPYGGADLEPLEIPDRPFGHHGWLPWPIMLCGMAQLFFHPPVWRLGTFWRACTGFWWGQLHVLVTMVMAILPSFLGSWCMFLPWECAPMAALISSLALLLSLAAIPFWSHAAAPVCRHASRRRSFFSLLQTLGFLYLAIIGPADWFNRAPPLPAEPCKVCRYNTKGRPNPQYGKPPPPPYEGGPGVTGDFATKEDPRQCYGLWEAVTQRPSDAWAYFLHECKITTPQSMGTPASLLVSVIVAVFGIFVVVDAPGGYVHGALDGGPDPMNDWVAEGAELDTPPLWGPMD